ncbi:MAG TPA: response regulator transcription factor [Dehalococcoidia bacterium]|nr:response regulator transcription factor [Dehalococcoidia bacterium]
MEDQRDKAGARFKAMPTRILVIEDEADIASFVRRGLSYKGYEVEVVPDGNSGLTAARERPPDLVLLDLMLPDIDGVEVCRRLRATSDLPIIVLTARDDVSDKIAGLDAGADDYVTKPFVFDELLARIRAALRRSHRPDELIEVGDLVIHPASREVRRGDRRIDLTPREYDLLEFLARNAGRVLTKEVIFSRVWGYDAEVESDAVKVYVSYLRKKLNATGEPDLIHMVRGVGYMLKAS